MIAERYRPVRKVAVRVIDGKAVMLTIADSKLHRLNGTATRVWEGLEHGRTTAEIVDGLCGEYGVARETAQADVEALLHGLVERGILVPVGGGAADGSG